jgi:hypothetical protein
MKSILDRTFRYRPSYATDVRETWERVRREMEAAAKNKVIHVNRSKKTR